jgi:hypothetical protein
MHWKPARTPPWSPVGSPTQGERQRAEQREHAESREARHADSAGLLTEEEVVAIVEELGDVITVLRDAEPEHQLDVYRNLGLRLAYIPETRTVRQKSILPRTVGHRFVSVDPHSPMAPRLHLAGTVSLDDLSPR